LLTLSSATGIATENIPADNYLKFYPNPFQNHAVITYGMTEDARVTITAYNILGEKIVVLADKQMQKGVWSETWNGTGAGGVKLAPGVYYIGMKANKFSSQIKVVIIK
jgi:flagellar hook assembly protein FlgD